MVVKILNNKKKNTILVWILAFFLLIGLLVFFVGVGSYIVGNPVFCFDK